MPCRDWEGVTPEMMSKHEEEKLQKENDKLTKYLCAIISTCKDNGTFINILSWCKERYGVNLDKWIKDHYKEDQKRLVKELSKYTPEEIRIIKGILKINTAER